jgi:hypothetical protein
MAWVTPGSTCSVEYVGVYFSYHREMRKMPGMSGDVEEHPASSSAARCQCLSLHLSL